MAASEPLNVQNSVSVGASVPTEWATFRARFGPRLGKAAERVQNIMADLSRFGLIEVKGEEAGTFLGRMLTGDVRLVSPAQGQFTSWCDVKGRILATFWLFMRDDAYYLLLPADLLPGVIARLKMFLLRTQANIADASESLVRIGLSGAGIGTVLGSALPVRRGETTVIDNCTLVALGDEPGPRWLAVGGVQAVMALWEKLEGTVAPADDNAWALLDILAGIPHIVTDTAGEFIPQMLDLEALGGLSYNKGCYPGQEVIARLRYRGQLKRKVCLAYSEGTESPAPGTRLYRPGFEESVGTVVSAARDGREHDVALLAVVVIEQKPLGDIRLGSADGPALVFADQDDLVPVSDAGC